MEALEDRRLLSAAFDLIGLTDLRSDSTYTGVDGTGVSVAVIDTGLDRTHPALSGNYLAGADMVYGGSIPTPTDSHGTHVAGIIGSTNPEIGVATNVGLIGLQVFQRLYDGSVGAYDRDINEALQWVIDHRSQYNIVAVNMSLGSGFYVSADDAGPSTTWTLIRQLESVGVTVVSAAGNSFKGHEYQNSSAPGVYSTFDVGAVWQDGTTSSAYWGDGSIDYSTGADRITSFSQRPASDTATLFAPGAMIYSTIPGGRYETEAGTSMASPMVAGAVALVQQAAMRFGGRYLSTSEVRSVIASTADRIYDGDDEQDNVRNTSAWYPRLNVYEAVKQVRTMFNNIAPPPPGGDAGDANGTLAGAYIGPTLNGSAVSSIVGNIGVDGTGTQIGDKDVDIVKITVASAGTLTLSLSNPTGGTALDSHLRLFDSSGNQLAANDNKSGTDLYSSITYAAAAGTFYVGISGAPNSNYDPNTASSGVSGATGDWSLSFSLSSGDPNGVIAGATSVTLGSDLAPASFNGSIGADYGQNVGTADVDLFKFTAPENGTISIDIDTPYSSDWVDSFLRVFNDSGVERASSDDWRPDNLQGHATDSFIELAVVRGETYCIGVSDYYNQAYNIVDLSGRSSAGAGGQYDITFSFASDDLDGTITQLRDAQPLTLPTNGMLASIGFDTDGAGNALQVGDRDVDFVKIQSALGGILKLDVDSHSGANLLGGSPVDTVLMLWDSDGNLLATNDDADSLDPLLQYTIEPNVIYFVSISGYGNTGFDPFALGSGTDGDTGSYILNAELLPGSERSALSNDVISDAGIADLVVGVPASGVLGSDDAFVVGPTDVDLWRFTPATSGSYRFATGTTLEGGADTFLRIFDSQGNEITWNDDASADTTSSEATVGLTAGATYYLSISGDSEHARDYNIVSGEGSAIGSQGAYTIVAGAVAGLPMVSIDSQTVVEGSQVTLTLTLSEASDAPITVDFLARGISATEGADFTAAGGTVTFDPGILQQTITIETLDDAMDEDQEKLHVELSNPTGASLAAGFGEIEIEDNDAAPAISINDVTVNEGNSGYTSAVFTISLSQASGREVTVDLATATGTASSNDFVGLSGTLTFAPGETQKTVGVYVRGDRTAESNEQFTLQITGAQNATVADDTGVGTIRNDDLGPQMQIARLAGSRAFALSSGASVSFGTAYWRGTAPVRIFRIANTGSQNLYIYSLRVPRPFVVLLWPATRIPPGYYTTFRIAMPTSWTGTLASTVTISSNDPAVSSFRMNLSGTVRTGYTQSSLSATPASPASAPASASRGRSRATMPRAGIFASTRRITLQPTIAA